MVIVGSLSSGGLFVSRLLRKTMISPIVTPIMITMKTLKDINTFALHKFFLVKISVPCWLLVGKLSLKIEPVSGFVRFLTELLTSFTANEQKYFRAVIYHKPRLDNEVQTCHY